MKKLLKSFKFKKIHFKIIIFIILIVLFVLYSRYIATSGLIVKEYKVVNNSLSNDFHGTKIVQFSDLHYGRTVKKKELENVVSNINKLNPDIVVFTGDLIDHDIKISPLDISILENELKKINSKLGKYYISGNHDYDNDEYDSIMTFADFKNLDNNYDLIYNKNETPIYICGLSSYLERKYDFNKATRYQKQLKEEKLPLIRFSILLVHEPDIINTIDYSEYNIDLILAGHSHGGQIRLPFIGSLYNTIGAINYNESYYRVINSDLYISSGIGTSKYNFRLFNKPSINLYRLTKY